MSTIIPGRAGGLLSRPADDDVTQSARPDRPDWVRWLPVIGAVALWLLVMVLPLRAEFRAPVSPQDEGLLLEYPALMIHGAVPNGTFMSAYGAGSYWPVAGAFWVFGASVKVERFVALAYWFVLSGSIFVLVARRRGAIAGGLAASASVLLVAGAVGLIAYAWMGALALGALGLCLLDTARGRPRADRAVSLAAGAAFGLAVSYRLDLALAVGLVVVVLLFVDRRRLAAILPGGVIGLLPLVVNIVQAGPAAVLRGQLLWPTFRSGPGRHLPLDWAGAGGEFTLALCVVIAFMLVGFGLATVRRGQSYIPLVVGLFDAGLLPQGFQRADGIHIAYVACFVLPSALLAPFPRRADAARARAFHAAGIAAAALLVVLVVPLGWSSYRAQLARSVGVDPDPEYVVANAGRSVKLGSPQQAQDLQRLLAELDRRARPGAHVFVGPDDLRRTNLTDTYIYFLLPQLAAGSFYLEMEPGITNARDSGLARQIEGNEWLVLTSEWDPWSEPNASMHYGSDRPNRVVSSQFSMVGRWGPWELLKKNPSS